MSRHRFLVTRPQLLADEVSLQGDELRHLKVRRIQPGEPVVLSDGAGAERDAVVASIDRERAVLRCVGARREQVVRGLRITLGQALLKSDKLDLVVEKATELGVESILLFESERVVAGMSAARLGRLRRLAQSAAKQAQRAHVPDIGDPTSLSSLLDATRSDAGKVVFWEESDVPLRQVVATLPAPQHLVILIGPEGGFSPVEVEAARQAGYQVSSLGPHILRAETAAIAAIALCRYAWAESSVV